MTAKKLEPTALGVRGAAWRERSGDVTQSAVHVSSAGARKLHYEKADGTVGEVMSDEVLAALLAQANVPFVAIAGEVVRSVRDEEILGRRRAGLPDLCEGGCLRELGMAPKTVRRRNRTSHPWLCHSCALKKPVFGADVCDDCGVQLSMTRNAAVARRAGPRPWRCRSCARKKPTDRVLNAAAVTACDQCAAPLSTEANRVRKRARTPRPWLCNQCGCRKNPRRTEKAVLASAARQRRATHCKRGHSDWVVEGSNRLCRLCRNEAARRSQRAKRERLRGTAAKPAT